MDEHRKKILRLAKKSYPFKITDTFVILHCKVTFDQAKKLRDWANEEVFQWCKKKFKMPPRYIGERPDMRRIRPLPKRTKNKIDTTNAI